MTVAVIERVKDRARELTQESVLHLQCGDRDQVDDAGGCSNSYDRRDNGLVVVVSRTIPCGRNTSLCP